MGYPQFWNTNTREEAIKSEIILTINLGNKPRKTLTHCILVDTFTVICCPFVILGVSDLLSLLFCF